MESTTKANFTDLIKLLTIDKSKMEILKLCQNATQNAFLKIILLNEKRLCEKFDGILNSEQVSKCINDIYTCLINPEPTDKNIEEQCIGLQELLVDGLDLLVQALLNEPESSINTVTEHVVLEFIKSTFFPNVRKFTAFSLL